MIEALSQSVGAIAIIVGAVTTMAALRSMRRPSGCPGCSYIAGAPTARCPECGLALSDAAVRRRNRTRRQVAASLLLIAGGFASLWASSMIHAPAERLMPAGVLMGELTPEPQPHMREKSLRRLELGELTEENVKELVDRSTSYLDSHEGRASSAVVRVVLFNAMGGDEPSRRALVSYMSTANIAEVSEFIMLTWGNRDASWATTFVIDCICSHPSEEIRVQAVMAMRTNKEWVAQADAHRALKCGLLDGRVLVRELATTLIPVLKLDDESIASLLRIADADSDAGVRELAQTGRAKLGW